MAYSTPSKKTDGKANYKKLFRLVVDGGTQAVRSVFDGIHPPSSLTAVLNTNKTTLQKLKKPKGKVLNNEQWDKLYPPSGSKPKSEDFDVTLLFVLLRNICGLTPPATGWDDLPPMTDNSLESNLARIKYYRNEIVHKSKTEISDVDFEQYWQDISSALLSLGLSQDDIDDLKFEIDEEIKSLNLKTEEIKSDTTEIREKLQVLCEITQPRRLDHYIDKLAKDEFRSLIESLCKSFHPNTRQWILDQVKSHVENDQPESCIMLITAGLGMGKSTVAAKICQMYKDLGCLGGCHFFQFSNSTRNNPRLMLQSIARQMCDNVPGYQEVLEKKLETNLGGRIVDLKCEELFTVLFEEPLHKLETVDSARKKFVIVLDAIDECSSDLKPDLLQILKNKLSMLPSWLRFVITMRPNTCKLVENLTIDPVNQENEHDLVNFFSSKLEQVYGIAERRMVKQLVEISEGLFLVAFFLVDYLEKPQKVSSPSELLGCFPNGISSVYEKYFLRLKEELLPYISDEERFYKMLEAVVAGRYPIPIQMFYAILGFRSERDCLRSKRPARKDALNSLHLLFPIENGHVSAFHKSVVDWLILQEDEEHDFSVNEEDGNEVLANQCYDVLKDIRNGKKKLDEPLELTDSENFSLTFGLTHMKPYLRNDKESEKLRNYFILCAMMSCLDSGRSALYIRMIPDLPFDINVIFSQGIKYFSLDASSSLHSPNFGRCVEFVLQAANMKNVSEDKIAPNPLGLLKKYNLSYYEIMDVSVDLEQDEDDADVSVIACENGFLLVQDGKQETTVQRHLLNGTCVAKKSFPGVRRMCISPDYRSIVVTKHHERDVEILDASTLELGSTYKSPGVIESCHVFGDQPWYTVARCSDNKIYVMEGETGVPVCIKEVNQNVKVEAVSSKGHVVLGRPWCEGLSNYDTDAFFTQDSDECQGDCGVKVQSKIHKYLLVDLTRSLNGHNLAPIESDALTSSRRAAHFLPDFNSPNSNSAFRFSVNGVLLAYLDAGSTFLINTSDGSLHKRVWLGPEFCMYIRTGILFLSDNSLVVYDYSIIMFIDVKSNKIQHIYMLPDNSTSLHLIPKRNQREPFRVLTDFYIENKSVKQFVFHNIDV